MGDFFLFAPHILFLMSTYGLRRTVFTVWQCIEKQSVMLVLLRFPPSVALSFGKLGINKKKVVNLQSYINLSPEITIT